MIKIGITQGDINGIGYEVIFKALINPHIKEVCIPVIYGSAQVAAYHRKYLGMESLNLNIINSAYEARRYEVNLVNCSSEEVKVELGNSTPQAGLAAYQSLERCTQEYAKGLIGAMVTAPINKDNIQNENFKFLGHTEYLENRLGEGKEPLMILACERLRVALATTHLPIAKVAENITKENIMKKIEILARSMEEDFGIFTPKIAVLGLNPHIGDNGVIGKEDMEIILPAIKEMQNKGCFCFGPYPADGFFGSGNYERFDVVLAMYHDQGLVPLKLIAQNNGFNFTAGLPIIRTSPAHGVAYDIAGRNRASADSFISSLYAAIDIYEKRMSFQKIHSNPLQKASNEKLPMSGSKGNS